MYTSIKHAQTTSYVSFNIKFTCVCVCQNLSYSLQLSSSVFLDATTYSSLDATAYLFIDATAYLSFDATTYFSLDATTYSTHILEDFHDSVL